MLVDDESEANVNPEPYAEYDETIEVEAVPFEITKNVLPEFEDHFTLAARSTKIHQSTGDIRRCIEIGGDQFLLEAVNDTISHDGPKETLKRSAEVSAEVKFLRLLYSLAAIVWSAFMAVFATMLLLFLCLDFTIFIGETSLEDLNTSATIGKFELNSWVMVYTTYGFR